MDGGSKECGVVESRFRGLLFQVGFGFNATPAIPDKKTNIIVASSSCSHPAGFGYGLVLDE
jgi:hypothetical protein